MIPSILEALSPHARVATAVMPFLVAIGLRLILGKSRVMGVLLSAATVWFAINVLMAPYSAGMQRDIVNLRSVFR